MQGSNENYIFTFVHNFGKIILSLQRLFSQKSSNLFENPFTNIALNPKILQKSEVEKKISGSRTRRINSS